jgi:hypothetical protein
MVAAKRTVDHSNIFLLGLVISLYLLCTWPFFFDDRLVDELGLRLAAQLSVLVAWGLAVLFSIVNFFRWRRHRRNPLYWVQLVLAWVLVVVPLLFVAFCFAISFLLAVPIF